MELVKKNHVNKSVYVGEEEILWPISVHVVSNVYMELQSPFIAGHIYIYI